jgi:hypothetical protein
VLGWGVDLAFGIEKLQVLLRPPDKRLHFFRRFEECAVKDLLSLLEVCEVTGASRYSKVFVIAGPGP